MKKLKLKKIFESLQGRNQLIKALMSDDHTKAMQAMSNVKNDDLQLTFSEFNQLAKSVKDKDLDTARKMLDVEKDVGQMKDTSRFNPMTRQPWKQGPVQKQSQQQSGQAAMTNLTSQDIRQASDAVHNFVVDQGEDGILDFADNYNFSPDAPEDLEAFLYEYEATPDDSLEDMLATQVDPENHQAFAEEAADVIEAILDDPSAIDPDLWNKIHQGLKKLQKSFNELAAKYK